MRKKSKAIFIIIAVIIAGAVTYWQIHKNNIIKRTIQSAVKQKTDSLYYIHYDSSYIDEIVGNANFYNVTLQSDAAQKKILAGTDSLPNMLCDISVAEVMVKGVDIPGLLQNTNVAATEIVLVKPVVQIINTGVEKLKPFNADDTMQLYKKLLGKFASIKANSIVVKDGTLLITNKNSKPLTTVEGINISLRNFLIDSSRNYNNLVSYFIKDIKVSINNIQLPETQSGTRINIEKLFYDAPGRKLQIGQLHQYKTGDIKALAGLDNIVFNELNTDAFIQQKHVEASGVTCDGGVITIYRKEKALVNNPGKSVEFSSEFIDAIQIGALQTGNITVVIKDQSNPGADPLTINDVKCKVSNIKPVTSGSAIASLINDAVWEISAGGFSFLSGKKNYKFSASGITVNSGGALHANEFLLKPLLSENAFAKAFPFQADRYDFSFKNLDAGGIDFKKLIGSNILEMQSLSLQPTLKIFNDRTLPPNPGTVEKKYPHQALLDFPFRLFIKSAHVKNGAVYYKERAKNSKQVGMPYFTAISSTIENITNIPERIKQNGRLTLKAACLFLGKQRVSTGWILPLRASDSVLSIGGEASFIDGTALNPVIEPLAMLSVKSGIVHKLNFNFLATDHKATGTLTLLYNDLKVEVLKIKEEELKKKTLLTFFANTLIKNDNPQNNTTREGIIGHNRDIKRSFFNMIWKSILSGLKSTVLGKK